eukprot:scaffold998_cov162-Ochromonas_danica.AAC.5
MEEILSALKLSTVTTLWQAIRDYCLDPVAMGEDSQQEDNEDEDTLPPVGEELRSPDHQQRQRILLSIVKNYHLAIAFLGVIDQTLTKANADSPELNNETQAPSQDLTQAVRMIREAREQLRTLTRGREDDSVIQSVIRKLQRISLPFDRVEMKKDIEMVIQLLFMLHESSILYTSQAVTASPFTPPRHSPCPPSTASIRIPPAVTYSSSFPPSTYSSLSVSFSPSHSFLLSARTRSASYSPTENSAIMPSQSQQRGSSHSAKVPLYHHKKRATRPVLRHIQEFEAKASGANRSSCLSTLRQNNKAISSCHFAGEAVNLQSASLEEPLESMLVQSTSLSTYVPSYEDYVRALSPADNVTSLAAVSCDSYLLPAVYSTPNNISQSPLCNDREHIQVRMMISWLNAIDRLCRNEEVDDDLINRVAEMKASLTSLLRLTSMRELQHNRTDLCLSIDRLKACGEDIKEISRSLEVSDELCHSLDALVHSLQLLDDIIIMY